MPSGGNHYTQWILELHGLEYSKMQRNDCYQTLQGSEKKSACATGLTQLFTLTLDVLRELNLMFILPWVDYLQKDCVSP